MVCQSISYLLQIIFILFRLLLAFLIYAGTEIIAELLLTNSLRVSRITNLAYIWKLSLLDGSQSLYARANPMSASPNKSDLFIFVDIE